MRILAILGVVLGLAGCASFLYDSYAECIQDGESHEACQGATTPLEEIQFAAQNWYQSCVANGHLTEETCWKRANEQYQWAIQQRQLQQHLDAQRTQEAFQRLACAGQIIGAAGDPLMQEIIRQRCSSGSVDPQLYQEHRHQQLLQELQRQRSTNCTASPNPLYNPLIPGSGSWSINCY